MIPLENFWTFVFFFVTLCAFFLDYKPVTTINIGIFVSLVISWFLGKVSDVIVQVQDCVAEMNHFVEQNSGKLNTQNEFLAELFAALQEMIKIIHTSIEGISTADVAQMT